MKKVLTVLVALLLVVSAIGVSASAAVSDPVLSPNWTNTSMVAPNITFANGVGYAELTATAKYSPKTFTVDTYVYIQSGSDWVYVTEQHDSKTGMSIGTSCPFTQVSGGYYKAEFYLTVSGGGATEELSFTAYG